MSPVAFLKDLLTRGMPLDMAIEAAEAFEAFTRPPEREGRYSLLPKDWKQLRLRIFERDEYHCRYCGSPCESPHCDHVLPLSRGGASDDDNLVTACPKCNVTKKDRTPCEWGVPLIGGNA